MARFHGYVGTTVGVPQIAGDFLARPTRQSSAKCGQSGYNPFMRKCRIHIFGASGAGVTTLGRATADALAFPHHDTDDYYWLLTAPLIDKSAKLPIASGSCEKCSWIDRIGS